MKQVKRMWPVAAQIGGTAVFVTGVGLALGVAVALIVAGVVLAAAGALREGKLI